MNVSYRQCCEGCLRLLEVSLDIQLVHNALQLDLEGVAGSTPFLLPDVTVHEYNCSSVVVLFATSLAVYRLTLPHPNNIFKVSIYNEGTWPSSAVCYKSQFIASFCINDPILLSFRH